MGIKENMEGIRAEIARICNEKGWDREEIGLMAVSKTIEPERIQEAVEAGIRLLGENKVQEILQKHDGVEGPHQWHMIGHLQRNKVRQIIGKVAMIQSLDSMRLALEIEKRASSAGIVMECLIQVNIGEEASKSGIPYEEAETFLKELRDLDHVAIRGLMAIAPYEEDPEDARPYFKRMRALFDHLRENGFEKEMAILSMGMSHDYRVALEEGANLVRIGTGIFGSRDYTK